MLCIDERRVVYTMYRKLMVGQVVRAGTGRQVALYKYIHGTEGIDPLWGGGGYHCGLAGTEDVIPLR